jgi:glycosyltransferase involved in cell wall biosynthesis
MRSGVSKILYQLFGAFGFEYIKVFARWVKGKEKFPGWKYAFLGQKKSMRKLLSHASAVLTASKHEQRKIEGDFQLKLTNSYVVHLGSEHISTSETKLQNRKGGICVARIERLKNQLNLIKAFNSLNENLKIVGQAATHQKDYWEACKQQAKSNIQFLGYLDGEELKDQFSSSKVHILPSYYETTGLATIEALKLGCRAVVSDQETQRELFGEHVFYCDPNQPEAIVQAVQEAMQNEQNHSDWVKENFSWVKAAHQISDIYRTISRNT